MEKYLSAYPYSGLATEIRYRHALNLFDDGKFNARFLCGIFSIRNAIPGTDQLLEFFCDFTIPNLHSCNLIDPFCGRQTERIGTPKCTEIAQIIVEALVDWSELAFLNLLGFILNTGILNAFFVIEHCYCTSALLSSGPIRFLRSISVRILFLLFESGNHVFRGVEQEYSSFLIVTEFQSFICNKISQLILADHSEILGSYSIQFTAKTIGFSNKLTPLFRLDEIIRNIAFNQIVKHILCADIIQLVCIQIRNGSILKPSISAHPVILAIVKLGNLEIKQIENSRDNISLCVFFR